jgi:hypothetical protein
LAKNYWLGNLEILGDHSGPSDPLWWNDADRRKMKYWEKILSNGHLISGMALECSGKNLFHDNFIPAMILADEHRSSFRKSNPASMKLYLWNGADKQKPKCLSKIPS